MEVTVLFNQSQHVKLLVVVDYTRRLLKGVNETHLNSVVKTSKQEGGWVGRENPPFWRITTLRARGLGD